VFERPAVRESGLLNVGEEHEIYWEESGRSNGIPAVYLHGGPGGTLGTGYYRSKFDPSRFRVNGVSWGSTLALAYAQAYPERVLGVVLMAVTTTDRFQVDWITETVGAIFPEAWDRLAGHAEAAGIGYRRGQARLVEAYAQLMAHADPAVLERMDHLHGVPGTLIHGRLDVSGPTIVAWRLHRSWPGSELIIHEGDGHGGPAMVEAWCDANTRHADGI
jgi:proline iminopeptidase